MLRFLILLQKLLQNFRRLVFQSGDHFQTNISMFGELNLAAIKRPMIVILFLRKGRSIRIQTIFNVFHCVFIRTRSIKRNVSDGRSNMTFNGNKNGEVCIDSFGKFRPPKTSPEMKHNGSSTDLPRGSLVAEGRRRSATGCGKRIDQFNCGMKNHGKQSKNSEFVNDRRITEEETTRLKPMKLQFWRTKM